MEFNSRKFSNTALAICMRVLICVCAVGLLGYRASAGSGASSSATASSETASSETAEASLGVSPTSRTTPLFIVVGFLGGFVPHNEPHHPEVQLMQDLRQEYSKDVYFGLFENRKVGEAYRTILNRLGAKDGGALLEDKKRQARIVLFGHSWGASAVVALSRKLERAGIPVALTIQIDSVAKPFQNDWLIPPNVFQAVNFYQTHGLVHGRRKIVPADPVRTTILGNFLWESKGESAECHGFSWRVRLLGKGHTEIECDRKVWWQVETLLRRQLPNPMSTQTDTGELGLP